MRLESALSLAALLALAAGAGVDLAVVDRRDVVKASCETVRRG